MSLHSLALGKDCPTCGAPPTANCRNLVSGDLENEMDTPHTERINLVRTRSDHRAAAHHKENN